MVVVYPLSAFEDAVIYWAARIVPAAAGAVILLLSVLSIASTQV